jgi:hypothetical protein
MTDKSATLASALAAFQASLPRVGKDNLAVVKSDKGSYKYNYADLSDVTAAALPALAKHGLSFSAKPTLIDGKFVLEYTLRHVSGESDTGHYPLTAGTPQQQGSAITYARRYALSAVTGIVPDEDDDGQAAEQAHQQEPVIPNPSTLADEARRQLKAKCTENGWDLARVADLYDGDLKTEADAQAISAFTKSLFARSDSELQASL